MAIGPLYHFQFGCLPFDAGEWRVGRVAGATGTLEKQIASTLGVDEISIRRAASTSNASNNTGSLSGTVVSLGKRISSKVYVGYEQGLTGAASLVKINYALTKRWTVRLAAGSDNALDVFYKFTFD